MHIRFGTSFLIQGLLMLTLVISSATEVRAERSQVQNELLRIAQSGNVAALRTLNPTAEEINSTRDNSENPLLNVVIFQKGVMGADSPRARDFVVLLKELLARGADPNLRQGVGNVGNLDTPLHEAAKTCDVDSIEVLTGESANPASKNRSGKTPRMIAQAKRDDSAAKLKTVTDEGTREYIRAVIARCDLALARLSGQSPAPQQNQSVTPKPGVPPTLPQNPRSTTSGAGGSSAD